ncbi:MAG: uroporphyrinogen decarboxylase family protein [Terriglobia bacterium]
MKWYTGQNLPATHARPTFSESWFYQHYGMIFGEKYCRDPIFRTEQDREARRLLYDRFGRAGIGEIDPLPKPHLEICGHRLISGLLGCEIYFQNDQAPSCRHLSLSNSSDIASIPQPDLASHFLSTEFRRQGKLLMERYGTVDATINHGGPLNVAMSVLGSNALAYLIEAADVMSPFLTLIADFILECYDTLTVPFNPWLREERNLFIGNCPVVMISPNLYREMVLPADLHFRRQASRFDLHHCGRMDRYLEEYRKLEPINSIEVGWGSDLSAVRRAFPNVTLDLMINIYDLQTMPPETLKETISSLVQQAGPSTRVRDVWVADIGPEVPDEKILEFIQAVDSAFAP